MSAKAKRPLLHGTKDLGLSRYLVLYFTQAAWLTLGAYLYTRAYWPSSCRPHDVLQIYSCSIRLADQRGWIESALMTWLWSTPLLVALEISRHVNKAKA